MKQEQQTSIVRLFPITGRSHQLRVHLLALGHPIVGDEFYAHEEAMKFSERLELHAAELCFYHPETEKLQSIFVPCDFHQVSEPLVVQHFDPAPDLPDYKTLPRS